MKNIKLGSIISQANGNRFGVTKIIDTNKFFAIWVGNKSFTDKTTFNGFMRRGDFRCDNILFKNTKSGIRKIKAIDGVWGLLNDSDSFDTLQTLNA